MWLKDYGSKAIIVGLLVQTAVWPITLFTIWVQSGAFRVLIRYGSTGSDQAAAGLLAHSCPLCAQVWMCMNVYEDFILTYTVSGNTILWGTLVQESLKIHIYDDLYGEAALIWAETGS